ncbi:MAG TPA: putative baseplate assembly protein [Bryobacteraceae bacterium]|jgi:hypothetical protein
MIYNCCNDGRKAAILGNPTFNGIDYLEVTSADQRTLSVHCLNPAPTGLTTSNVLIQGGESITNIAIQSVAVSASDSKVLVIETAVAGDFSPYTLRLVNSATQAQEDSFDVTEALSGFDPQLAEVEFSFKVECGPDFDCKPPACDCPPQLPTPPAINYLAKDYGSFRTIMLDRMNQLLPNWGAATEADLGVALAELIAYVGDHLSYQQDAVSTEAYLQTARNRVSLRRHALLVDYHVHDGSNARAWIALQVAAPVTLDRSKTRFYTFAPGMLLNLAVGSGNEEGALNAGVIVFEPMQDAQLVPEHNQLTFYTWGDTNCCLLASATEATLLGTLTNLQPGDVLIFQEMVGPQTGNQADADIRHRCAVRLTGVATTDGQGNTLVDPLFEQGTGNPITSNLQTPTPVTEIQWSSDDALPFPVCLSSTYLDSSGKEQFLPNVSVAFGNVVLADHGLSISGKQLPVVPQPTIYQPPNPTADRCQPSPPVPLPARYRPQIPDGPITQAVPLPLAGSPVTPGVVFLLPVGFVSLADSAGFISLMARANNPLSWPQYFGVVANPDAAHSGNFDLSIVCDPGAGPNPITLENFTNLSINPADPNYAATQVNKLSKFVQVPASYAPPATSPTSFPTTPTMLPNSASINLLDSGGNPYLLVQATNPAAWPPSFGVLAQGDQQNSSVFNLLVVYSPSSGGVGVQVPIVVEQFNAVTLDTVGGIGSKLIAVESFSGEPNLSLSAYDLTHYDGNQAVPVITLTGSLNGISSSWTAEPDLLADSPTDKHFVVEIESDGTARLRFGDNVNGLRPDSGTSFTASYRIGNGIAGNVGANALIFLAADPLIQACTNPLPASGGTEPETNDQIRRRAPQAFMTQERAVTMADYERVTEMNSQVDNAVATLRWTGSWYTVFITAEPEGAGNLTPALAKALRQNINRYRLAGQDIQLESPEYVPLQITLAICVDSDYFQSDVRQGLQQVLGSTILPNGQKGLFYPDNFTFGQTVYLSPIYAAARQVPGVQTVTATVFAPQGVSTNLYLAMGEIPLGPFQIARMDNDPSFPNHGQLTLVMEGGK